MEELLSCVRVESVHKTMVSRSSLRMREFLDDVIGSENAAGVGGIKSEIEGCEVPKIKIDEHGHKAARGPNDL